MNAKSIHMIAKIKNPTSTEPAVNTGAFITALPAVFVILNLIFPHAVTAEWETTVYGLASILGPLITGIIVRRKVWSPASVHDLVKQAVIETEREAAAVRMRNTQENDSDI